MSKSVCRACLSEKDHADLCDWYLRVTDLNEPLTYQECFKICTQLDVEKADASSSYVKNVRYLCQDCVQQLLNSYRFMKKAQKSARELYYLSQKDEDESSDANEFEWVNIQNLCKSVESTDLSRAAEQTLFEDVIKGTEDISMPTILKDTEKLDLVKTDVTSLSPLLPTTSKPSKCIGLESNMKETDTQGTENLKLKKALKMNEFDCDADVKEEMVEYIDCKVSGPLIETVSSHEAESEGNWCSVACDSAILKKESKSTPKSRIKDKKSTVQRVRSKVKRTKNGGKEFKETPCEHCQKLFPENKLKQHQSRYHRPKVFLCDICPSAFSIANNLRRHQRTHDLNRERNYTCEDCGRKFFTEDVYRTHIKIHQSTRKPLFKCTECDKVFMHKGSLTLHIEKHTGPKNECSICQKRYVRKIDLEVHMRNHSGDLPYSCSKCGKAFMTTSALRKHELLHSGIRFKCDICNKEYSHPSKLSRHRLEHTGLPLTCAICNKGFSEPNKIRRHIGSVHKVEDIDQINKLIVRVSKNDGNTAKENTN
ncbi:zinc finger protein 79-like [Eurosta solidaginis]|uniref:zinc finger protein 79-like n=1 Tax=Eurosta solidaginis TaxID=178769 RepID=UPI0035305EC2